MAYTPNTAPGRLAAAASESVTLANEDIALLQKTVVPQDTDTYESVRVLPQRKNRYDFSRTVASGVDTTIATVMATGSGMTVSQSSSNLVITSGTTARSETIIRSVTSWQDAMNFKWSMLLSQRIANCNVYLELVDVIGDSLAYTINSATSITVTFPTTNPFIATDVNKSVTLGNFVGTGTFLSGANNAVIASISGLTVTLTVAGFAAGTGTLSMWGLNYQHVVYTGTTATSASYGTQRSGWPFADFVATINTTASPGHDGVINVEDDMATFLDAVGASTTGIQYNARAVSHRTMPSGEINLYWQIRVLNLATAPASTTTVTVGYVDIENYVPQQVSMTSLRPMGSQSPLPVQVLSSATVLTQYSGTTAPAALSDSQATPTAQPVGAFTKQYNGTSWDEERNNINATTGDTGAKTATFNGATNTNFNARGVIVTCLIGAVTGTSPTISLQPQWSPDGGTTWLNYGTAIAAFTPVSGNTATFGIYPTQWEDSSSTTLAAFTMGATQYKLISAPLPRVWRLVNTIGGTTPSITLTGVYVNYLL